MNLTFRQVSKVYGEIRALDAVSLSVDDASQFLVLVGPSGGGKSTFLRVLAGLTVPEEGEVILEGEPIRFDPPSLLAHRRSHGFVFQSWNLFPHLTALENITLPLTEVHGWEPAGALARAKTLLERFHVADQGSKRPAELSGGQQQRVALARALAPRPRLLLLDEPTSALDPEMTAEVLEVLEDLARGEQQIILSTHEMGFARQVADRVLFLSGGKVGASQEPESFFSEDAPGEVRAFLSRVMRY